MKVVVSEEESVVMRHLQVGDLVVVAVEVVLAAVVGTDQVVGFVVSGMDLVDEVGGFGSQDSNLW